MAIKYDVNQTKTKWQYQRVDTKNDPLKSASASLALNLVTLNVSNEQVNDDIHCIKIPKRKTNGDLLSKKKILEEYGDVFDTLGCLPGMLHLEVDKSTQPVHVSWKIPVAMKEKIMNKIDKLIEQKLVAKVNEPIDWISSSCCQETTKQETLYWPAWSSPNPPTLHNQQLKIF